MITGLVSVTMEIQTIQRRPYGTRLWVQGYGWGQALDTGGMIRAREDLIDVFKDTYEEAIHWGRRKVIVVWEN